MKTFKLSHYATYHLTWVDDYEIQAKTLEEAIEKIRLGEEIPVNQTMIDDPLQDPIEEIIEDHNGNVLYEENNYEQKL